MSDFLNTNQESKRRWEINAGFWDEKMGDDSNQFHREVVRPLTETLLSPKAGELILDAACGTGNFSQRLAELGADFVAFDFSEIMIANAKRRRAAYEKKISFFVCDATKKEELLGLRQTRLFDKAVSNMGMMDISELRPLLQAVYELLKPGGSFVFSTHHPCFERPADKYMTSCVFS